MHTVRKKVYTLPGDETSVNSASAKIQGMLTMSAVISPVSVITGVQAGFYSLSSVNIAS
jgi:hypothetical protein